MSAQESQKVVDIKHPITGITHALYLQNAELVKMPMGRDGNRCFYAMHSKYEIEPALPQGDTLLFNNSIQYTEPVQDRFGPTAAASIGIIGGADGPTAIFVSSTGKEKYAPRGLHGLPLHNCFTIPSFQKADYCRFVLEGINTHKCDEQEYIFQ
jgi:hypothetical protein